MAGVGQKTSGFQDYALRSAYQVSGFECQVSEKDDRSLKTARPLSTVFCFSLTPEH